MRILILGGDGMLGHRLLRQFAPNHEVRVTVRQPLDVYRSYGLFDRTNTFDAVDARDPAALPKVLGQFAPDAVINAVGVIKQRPDAKDGVLSIEVNSLFPHMLARLCEARGARLVHLSTDCVFSGAKGNYAETDRPDPVDVYGFSKLLGEVIRPQALTLRTSMIGTELARKTGLVEWFLSQRGKMIKGYRKAIFSGFTTVELARVIERLLISHPQAAGLYHVSAAPISKFDLLSRLSDRLDLGIRIDPDDAVAIDRSLDSGRFRREFGYAPPSWDAMLDELASGIRQT
ncbi:MAG TPA: SDR family oxidoreductase [Burkholderiales bacterium]|nr:SDR family oxidoreductase [Burkholderiales bacterium]